MRLYGIKSCDTVRKARNFLASCNQAYDYHDFRLDGLQADKLQEWINAVGWKTLLNTRSTSWRQLEDSQKQGLDDEKAQALMLENPTLIKRPVLESKGQQVVVGFKQAEYQQLC